MLEPDLETAAAFLRRLDESEQHTFQVIHDTKKRSRSHIYHGTIWDLQDELVAKQRDGYGVFVCINATDGKGRETKNITAVRAFAADLDGAPKENIYRFGLVPSITIESSPGKWHAWWVLESQTECPLEQYTPTMERIARIIESDHKICDLPRVLRVPGFYHQKGEPFQTRIVDESPRTYEFHEVLEELDSVENTKKKVKNLGATALEDACEKVAKAEAGTRNDTLFKQAHRIAHAVRKGLLDYDTALNALMGAAQVHAEGASTIKEQFERNYKKLPDEKPVKEIILYEGQEEISARLLLKVLVNTTKVYRFSGRLVSPFLEERKEGSTVPVLRELTHPVIVHLVQDQTVFAKVDGKGAKTKVSKLPRDITDQITGVQHWPEVPICTGVINTPTLRSDGTLIQASGYDESTGYYLEPDRSLRMPDIPERPSKTQALDALNKVKTLFTETSFVSPLDEAVTFCAALTVVCRPAFDRCPMFLVNANAPGTGKSYLVDTLTTLAQGKTAPVISSATSNEEMEKRLDGLLLDGVPCFSIDNILKPLLNGPEKLCMIFTAKSVRVRKLGVSDSFECEPRVTVFATGNGVTFGSDMIRRGLTIRLSAPTERPEEREYHASPMAEVMRNRGEYVAALLTIARAYRVSGEKVKTHPLVSFEAWGKVCLEPLMWLGLPNPLDCLELTRFKDDYENQRRDFVKYLAYKFPEEQYFKAAGIKKSVEDDALMNENEGPQLLDYLKSVASFGSKEINLVALSKFISKLEDVIVDGHAIVRRPYGSGSSAWKVTKLC
jgi:putative DNA primase/helicase